MKDLGYKYPTKVRMVPGTKEHDDLVRLLMELATSSYNAMSDKYDTWDEIGNSLSAYVQLDDDEQDVLEGDDRKPVSIVVPIMFASLETILTYLVAAFINNPIFRYEGIDASDHAGAALLETLVDYQTTKAKVPLYLHTIWRDALAYGVGVGVVGWEQVTRKRTVRGNPIMDKLAMLFPGISYARTSSVVVDQTSTLFSIDPYRFLPDPNMPVMDVQRMSYVGWYDRDTLRNLQILEAEDSEIFNVDYLKDVGDGRLQFLKNNESVYPTHGDDELTKPIDVLYMYAKIRPSDYGLSASKQIEKWFFMIGAGSILLKAQPLKLDHDMFPVVVTSPDYDGHSMTPTSRLEVLYGMQKTIDWLFSSHIKNVRKAINDMIVVDPYLVNMADLTRPSAGRIIRLRKAAWGRGVSGAVEQLKVVDVTKDHISDVMFLFDIVQRVSAATDMVQGIMRRSSERRSATEAAGARESSLTRLEHIAKIISYQSMQDIGYMFGAQTIQLMSDQMIERIGAKVAEQLKSEYGVDPSPKLLNMEYDVKVHDGSVPGGENGQLWVQLYQIMLQNPELAGQFDMVRIFKHIARNLGAKEVESFVLKAKPLTPDQIDKGVQQGNLVPYNQYFSGGQNVQSEEPSGGPEGVPQLPNMG